MNENLTELTDMKIRINEMKNITTRKMGQLQLKRELVNSNNDLEKLYGILFRDNKRQNLRK